MNTTAQRKILPILIALLILFLGFLGYWYYKNNMSAKLPKEYEFLNPFVKEKTGKSEVEYILQGFIYKTSIKDENYSFNLNAWDSKNRKNIYIENVVLPINKFDGNKEDLEENQNLNIELSLKFKNNGYLYNWAYKPLNLDSNKITSLLKEMYINMKNFNKSVNSLLEPITTEVYESLQKDGKVAILHHNSDSLYNLTLYDLWLDSYLVKYKGEGKLKEFSQNIVSDNFSNIATDYLYKRTQIKNEIETLAKNNICESGDCFYPDSNTVQKSSYIQNNSLGCTLVKEIFQNSSNEEIKNLLSNEFCNSESIINDIEKIKENASFPYSEDDLLQSINLNRINDKPNYESVESMLPLENSINLIGDSFIAQDMNKLPLDEQNINNIKLSAIYDFLYATNLGIKDICNLAYSVNSASKYSNDIFFTNVLNTIKAMFLENTKETLLLLDKSSYASLLCIEVYKDDKDLAELMFSRIYKNLYINLYNDQNKKGLWEDDGYYNIRTNTRFIKILLENYEETY